MPATLWPARKEAREIGKLKPKVVPWAEERLPLQYGDRAGTIATFPS